MFNGKSNIFSYFKALHLQGCKSFQPQIVSRIADFRSLLLAFIQVAGCKPANASSRKTGGFTMLETLIGLALVSATGFVVTFMSANMMTSTQRKHDTYMCSSIAGNVLAHFSKNGSKVISKEKISTIEKKMGGARSLLELR